jgi:aspartyl-tRNA(Asn)/glutamyl-tRNA(Gln) amidotransferase subunit C
MNRMEVDRKLLEHVAEIARLKLSEEEIKKFLPQLKEALEFFSQLKDVNTDNVEPSFQPVELKNAMREDTEKECLSQDDVLSLTEHKKDGYFKGPRAV